MSRAVFLSMQFPVPPADSRSAVSELLLAFNLLWQEEPVIRMAADHEAGDVVMLAELPARDLRVRQLGAAFEKLRTTAERWRAAIIDGVPAAAEAGGRLGIAQSLLA